MRVILFLSLFYFTIKMEAINIVYPDSIHVDAKLLNSNERLDLIKKGNGKVINELYKPLTARTYILNIGQILVEFFDKQAILFNSKQDFERCRNVKFIKNKVGFLKPRISYQFDLTIEEAIRLIKTFKGKKLDQYKANEYSHYELEVFELHNKQVIIKYEDKAHMYENIEALAFDVDEINRIYYPNGWHTGKKEFIEGKILDYVATRDFVIYPKEAEQVINNHKLKKIEENIQFDTHFYSILYQSEKGYYILIEDFNQLNLAGTAKLGIGDARIFYSYNEFKEAYEKILKRREEFKKNPENFGGIHIYKELSDKYGKDFPLYTMEEIRKLPQLLNFDSTRLEFTKECVDIISEAIIWNYGEQEFFDALIYPLLAYVGECNKVTTGGNWDIKFDKKEKIWIPYFLDKDGKEVFDTLAFYKDYLEAEYGIPLVWYYIQKL